MKTVSDWFSIPPRFFTEGDVGIEVEVEGHNLPVTQKYWKMEEDGSLRGESKEYVLEKPSTLAQARLALKYLGVMYNKHESVVHDSVRAGVHVHINVQKLNIIELYNFMTVYIILEDLLTKYCGESREGNMFCLRTGDAEYLLHQLIEVAGNKRFKTLVTDDLRYASMNVKALGTYGSLEFRAMRGTRDLDAIYVWAEMLLGLREVAKTFKSPCEVVDNFSEGSALIFLQRCLGKHTGLFTGYTGWEKTIVNGMRRAQDVAYATDWEKFRLPEVVNPFDKRVVIGDELMAPPGIQWIVPKMPGRPPKAPRPVPAPQAPVFDYTTLPKYRCLIPTCGFEVGDICYGDVNADGPHNLLMYGENSDFNNGRDKLPASWVDEGAFELVIVAIQYHDPEMYGLTWEELPDVVSEGLILRREANMPKSHNSFLKRYAESLEQ